MDHTPPSHDAAGPDHPPSARTNWHVIAIAVMVIAFALVVWQRDRIRAHWWVSRIVQTEDFAERVHYVTYLAGIGDEAAGALDRLSRDPRPEVAGLAVAASTGLSARRRAYFLRQLLATSDDEVCYEAARALAFMDTPIALAHLISVVRTSDEQAAAAALSGLARLEGPVAMAATCHALQHAEPFVRAQAAESLGEHVRALQVNVAEDAASAECDPIEALVTALADDGSFTGQLAIEREIATVSAAVQSEHGLQLVQESSQELGRPPEVPTRRVSDVASAVLSDLTGQPISPQSDMNESDRRQLIDRCRAWISARAH